jgi:hypothetical protein
LQNKQNEGSQSLIIYYDPETGNGPLTEAIRKNGAKVLYRYQNFNAVAIKINKNQQMNDAIKYYEKVKGVSLVTCDEKMELNKGAQTY